MKKWLILVALVGAGLAAYFTLGKSENKNQILTATVKRADLTQSVEAVGEVYAENLVVVGAQVSGKIEKLFVKIGDKVKKGDKIAKIDAETKQNTLDQQEAELDIQNANLNSAQIAYDIARTQYLRELELAKHNATSKQNVENFKNTLSSAEAMLKELKSKIKKTKIEIKTARTNLGYTDITAPFDGTIVSVPVEVGQTLNANQTTPTVVNIADLTKMEIKMKVSEADIAHVKVGDKVRYYTIGNQKKIFEGTVSSIDPGLTTLSDGSYSTTSSSGSSSSSSSSSSAVYYYAKIRVDNTDGALRIGMTTQNEIIIAQIKNALSLPTLAIKNDAEGTYVLVKEGEEIRPVRVKTGISTSVDTEILEGLSEGQVIVTSQMSAEELAKTMKKAHMRMR